MGWWGRNLAIGASVGLVVGLVVGGTLGRIFMRILFLAREDTLGLETAMGALIGDFTGGGTAFVYAFGAAFGLLLGAGYVALRTLLPPGAWSGIAFVLGASALMLGLIVRANREDFAVLPVTLSLLLLAGSIALTAIPVPLLVERLAPDRARPSGRLGQAAVGLGLIGFAAYATTAIAGAYSVPPLF